MMPRLAISLAWHDIPPVPGSATLGEKSGGRETLLRWLETQLGLPPLVVPQATRTVRYAARLQKAGKSSFIRSLDADLWGTAKTLLSRRDELKIMGWDGGNDSGLPKLVQDLAAVEKGGVSLGFAEGDRLEAVLAALSDGQTLPEHEILLQEPSEVWPSAWRKVLEKLNVAAAKETKVANALIKSKQLTWWRSLSAVAAAEAVASSIAASGKAGETIVLCEDARLAELLDDALTARGVPAMGATAVTQAHPVLQALPLALGLMWGPADPEKVMDFFMLPVCPLPRSWSRGLAEALAERPGVGGSTWNDAVAKLAAASGDKGEERRERLQFWVASPEEKAGASLKQASVAKRCRAVSRWAIGRASMEAKEEFGKELAAILELLSAQAASLAEIAEAFPEPLSEPQLERLVTSVQEQGVETRVRPPEAKGPRWICSLAEVDRPCPRLVWFGVHSEEGPSEHWTSLEAAQLTRAGLDAGFEERRHAAKRSAERASLKWASGPVLAVELAAKADIPFHPVWLDIKGGLGNRQPESLERLIAEGGAKGDWPLSVKSRKPVRFQAPPAVWSVDPKLLKDRDSTSAGDLENRLGCPLHWTFEYCARLHSSPIAELAEGILLKGNLSHDILEEVFGNGKISSAKQAAAKTLKVFDRRIATDAATLASPAAARERLELRTQLEKAATSFFGLIERSGYKIVGFEVTPKAKLLGRDFRGRLDCVLESKSGKPALLDLKYAGIKKYSGLTKEGKALQLAVYLAALAQDRKVGKTEEIAAGYFIVDRGRMLTPSGGPLDGALEDELLEDAPSIASVWKNYALALNAAEGWLKSGKIPARPLQEPDEWPDGTEIAMTEIKKSQFSDFEGYSVCQYCAYGRLCGREEVS